jgi:hypothetical protein
MAVIRPLKSVGYWWSPETPDYPPPQDLVDPEWCPADRSRVVAYLRSGSVYAQWRGLSHCRFRCGAKPFEMGSRCLTDGIWVWPEGLSHYVEQHFVTLPSEFVRTMRRRDWRIPLIRQQPTRESHGAPDDCFWIHWSESRS